MSAQQRVVGTAASAKRPSYRGSVIYSFSVTVGDMIRVPLAVHFIMQCLFSLPASSIGLLWVEGRGGGGQTNFTCLSLHTYANACMHVNDAIR